MGNTFTAYADHLAVLRAGWNAQLRVPTLDRRHADLVAERRLRRRNAREVDEVVAVPAEEWMLLETDEDTDVAGRATAHAGPALGGHPQPLPVIAPRGRGS